MSVASINVISVPTLIGMPNDLIFLQETAMDKRAVAELKRYMDTRGCSAHVTATDKGLGVGVIATSPNRMVEWKASTKEYNGPAYFGQTCYISS